MATPSPFVMRTAASLSLSALLGVTLVALPACSSSKPAQRSAPTTASAPTRDEAVVMRTPPSGPSAQTTAGAQPRVFMRDGGGPGMNMTPEQRVSRRLNQLKEELALSEAQEGRIRALLLADAQSTPQMRREDMQNMDQAQIMRIGQQQQQRRERLNTAIEAELTADQKALYRAFVEQERERMMERARQMMNGGN